MASGSYTFSTTSQYITGKIEWSSTSNGATENSSDVTVKLYYKKSDNSSSKTYGTLKGKLYINGTAYSYSTSITLSPNNTYKLVASKTVEIDHKDDGTKSIKIDATGGISGTTFSSSSCPEKTIELDTIPRYATTTIGTISAAQTTLTIPWTASATLSSLRVYANGSLKRDVDVNSKSGTVTVSGLSTNTTYKIKLQGQRKDSGLWKYSTEKEVTTKPIASISSDTDVDFTVGNNLKFKFDNYNINNFYLALYYLNSSDEWSLLLTTDKMKVSSYTWDLSSKTSTLYKAMSNKNSVSIRIRCCTETATDEVKYYYKSGTMSINVSNNLPSAPEIACANTGDTASILGDSLYIPASAVGMTLTFTKISTAKNHASITSYNVIVKNPSGKEIKNVNLKSVAKNYIYNLGTFSTSGTYSGTVCAIDSRGNKSANVAFSFTVLKYKSPVATIAIERENSFERKTSFNLSVTYSSLKINDISKNPNLTIQYRYKEVGQNYNDYIAIDSSLLVLAENKDTVTATLTPAIEFDLDQKKSYNFQVNIFDALNIETPIKYSILVGQGIPVMAKMDSGHVSVGMVPDLGSDALFQVGSDIIIKPDGYTVPVSILDSITPSYIQIRATTDVTNYSTEYNYFPPFYENIETSSASYGGEKLKLGTITSSYGDRTNSTFYGIKIGEGVKTVRVRGQVRYLNNDAANSIIIMTRIYKFTPNAEGTYDYVVWTTTCDTLPANGRLTQNVESFVNVSKDSFVAIISYKGTASRDIDVISDYNSTTMMVETVR